ncbi:MAG: flagellar hook-basal body complex protein FliE [Phycisphaerae bacterium]|jgi:flagellar hook-basal body complex protein FliE
MTNPIDASNGLGFRPVDPAAPGSPGAPQPGSAGGKDFKTILLNSLEEVDRLQKEADQGVQRLVTGESDNVVEVLAAVNKAGIAFDLLMEVRNKLTDAYQEIQQMRV